MRINLLVLLGLCVLFPTYLISQEFVTDIIIVDRYGDTDTVQIGYDATASHGIDDFLGEEDISMNPLDTALDVRLTYLENADVECFYGDVGEPNEIFIQTKKSIIPMDCDDQSIYDDYLCLLIEESKFPVTLYWDKNDFFYNDCVFRSLVTPNFVTGWFDFHCGFENCASGIYLYINLALRSSVYYECPAGPTYINQFSDSLNVITFGLTAESSSTMISDEQSVIEIFPNPVEDFLVIRNDKENIEEIKIFDIEGRVVYFEDEITSEEIQLGFLKTGIYFFQVVSNSQQYMHKFLKE